MKRNLDVHLGILGFQEVSIIFDEDYHLTHIYFGTENIINMIEDRYIEEIKQMLYDQEAFRHLNKWDNKLKMEKEQ